MRVNQWQQSYCTRTCSWSLFPISTTRHKTISNTWFCARSFCRDIKRQMCRNIAGERHHVVVAVPHQPAVSALWRWLRTNQRAEEVLRPKERPSQNACFPNTGNRAWLHDPIAERFCARNCCCCLLFEHIMTDAISSADTSR
jgi:hypothetical protein